MHTEKPIFTAQFHPEAFGGPTDTEVTFMWLCYLRQQIKSENLTYFYFELWVPVSPQFLFDTFMDLVKGKRSSVTHAMSRPVKVPPPPKVRHLSHDYNPSYIPKALDRFFLHAGTLYLLHDHNWRYLSMWPYPLLKTSHKWPVFQQQDFNSSQD